MKGLASAHIEETQDPMDNIEDLISVYVPLNDCLEQNLPPLNDILLDDSKLLESLEYLQCLDTNQTTDPKEAPKVEQPPEASQMNSEDPLQCPHCPFKSKKHKCRLTSHINRVHLKMYFKKIICDMCGCGKIIFRLKSIVLLIAFKCSYSLFFQSGCTPTFACLSFKVKVAV